MSVNGADHVDVADIESDTPMSAREAALMMRAVAEINREDIEAVVAKVADRDTFQRSNIPTNMFAESLDRLRYEMQRIAERQLPPIEIPSGPLTDALDRMRYEVTKMPPHEIHFDVKPLIALVECVVEMAKVAREEAAAARGAMAEQSAMLAKMVETWTVMKGAGNVFSPNVAATESPAVMAAIEGLAAMVGKLMKRMDERDEGRRGRKLRIKHGEKVSEIEEVEEEEEEE